MDDSTITARLRSSFGDDVHSAEGVERCWLISSESASRTIVLEAGDDAVRIQAGRIVDALSLEDCNDLDRIVTLIEAIRAGRAYEYFGYSTEPPFGFIGYEVNAPGLVVVRVDEGARIIHKALV